MITLLLLPYPAIAEAEQAAAPAAIPARSAAPSVPLEPAEEPPAPEKITQVHIADAPKTPAIPESDALSIPEPDLILLAKTVWGEARGCTELEMAMVCWTVFHRVDAGFGTLEEVITAPHQFMGYRAHNPVEPAIYDVCKAAAQAWQAGDTAPTHPIYAPETGYLFFHGDGKHNYFRVEY